MIGLFISKIMRGRKVYYKTNVICTAEYGKGDVTVNGSFTIGEVAIVQAGSVVVKDILKLGIAGGNPTTVFKCRDLEHYYSLKAQELFR